MILSDPYNKKNIEERKRKMSFFVQGENEFIRAFTGDKKGRLFYNFKLNDLDFTLFEPDEVRGHGYMIVGDKEDMRWEGSDLSEILEVNIKGMALKSYINKNGIKFTPFIGFI